MSGLLGQRAVVVGAGIGGLAMAGALAKYFERVRKQPVSGEAGKGRRRQRGRMPVSLEI